MKNMEEKLWDYIDGACSGEEHKAIAVFIEQNTTWRAAYTELLEMNDDISTVTLDEPPMAFSYKVMEAVRAQEAVKPLKTKHNAFVIKGIALFFILSILLLIASLFTGMEEISPTSVDILTTADLSIFSSHEVVKAFLYFDIMLALLLANQILRSKRSYTAGKSV
jgi:hypothetical protein